MTSFQILGAFSKFFRKYLFDPIVRPSKPRCLRISTYDNARGGRVILDGADIQRVRCFLDPIRIEPKIIEANAFRVFYDLLVNKSSDTASIKRNLITIITRALVYICI